MERSEKSQLCDEQMSVKKFENDSSDYDEQYFDANYRRIVKGKLPISSDPIVPRRSSLGVGFAAAKEHTAKGPRTRLKIIAA